MTVRTRFVLRNGVRPRVDEVARGVQIERERALRRIASGHGDDLAGHLAHTFDVVGRAVRIGEAEIGDRVMPGELAHQVPGAQLSTLVERQQQVGLEPENAHGQATRSPAMGRAADSS